MFFGYSLKFKLPWYIHFDLTPGKNIDVPRLKDLKLYNVLYLIMYKNYIIYANPYVE